MSLSSDTAYLRYGQIYTGDNANTAVAQDSNLIMYAGYGFRWRFPPDSPRFFVGRVIYFREDGNRLSSDDHRSPRQQIPCLLKCISEMLKQGCTFGRWVHLGQIIHTVHHFLSRLLFLKQRAENKRQFTINKQCKEDLHFLLFVLG